jgi:thioesterase domain-containing protein
MVPGAGENPFYLLPLARHFKHERPFYALRDPRPAEERGVYSVEDVAQRYVQAVHAVQPHGVYLLGGHCLGGVVAFEMAQQLVGAGQQVGLLALFETAAPYYPSFIRHWSLHLAEVHRQLTSLRQGRRNAARLLESARGLGRHLQRRLQALMLKVACSHGLALGPLNDVQQANLRASQLYRPTVYPGRVVILAVEDHLQTGSLLDRRLGWRELAAGGIEVHLVPGDHFTSLAEPKVRELAQRLRTLAALPTFNYRRDTLG